MASEANTSQRRTLQRKNLNSSLHVQPCTLADRPRYSHIHEAAKGESGPPRLAFPNPKRTGKGDERRSKGCLQGPFETGILDEETGIDTGAAFKVAMIENDPEAFFCDVHSSLAVPGAIRGQLDDDCDE